MTANANIPTQYTQIKQRIIEAAQSGRWSDVIEGFTVVNKPDESHYAKVPMDQVAVSTEWAEKYPYLSRIISSALLGAVGSPYTIRTLPHQHKRAGQEIMSLPVFKRWEVLCVIAACHQSENKDYQHRNTDIAVGSFVWDGKKGYHPMKAEAIILGAVSLDKHYHAGTRGGEVSQYTLMNDTFVDTNCVFRKIKMPKGKITGDAHYAYSGDFEVEVEHE